MLGHPRHLELRSKLLSGEILGPHFYTTGPSFSGQSVKDPAQAAAMVREQKQAGYNYLKLHPGLSRENFDAVARTAKEVGIPFVGHVSFEVGIWHAIASGYSSIDHLDGFVEGLVPGIEKMPGQEVGLFGMFVADKADTRQLPRLMQGLKENKIWVVPTQALAERWFAPVPPASLLQAPEMVYMTPQVRRNWENSKRSLMSDPRYQEAKIKNYIQLRRQLILACQQNGVGLLLGCDAPQVFNVPGFSTHQELQYLVAAGLTPYQALQTGTVNVAAYLNLSATSGTVKVGAVSDLILLAGNPLKDITQTQKIEGVMLGPRWLPKTALQQALKKLEKN
jgi:Amidohydrolase family